MRLHVGCAMWSYAPWQGRHLPSGLPAKERLRAYSGWCDAVEGNTTFYATPARETVATWAAQTAPDFRFLLKIPKEVTHERRLIDVAAQMRAYLHVIEPLGPRVHALWIQLPPSFTPAGIDTLAAFLRRMPRDYRYAVEVRHRAFFDEGEQWAGQLQAAMAEFGAEWVNMDTTVLYATPPGTDAEHEAWTKKPRLPRRTHALTQNPVVRYIARDDAEVTAAGWSHWRDTAVQWLREGRSPTVFVHTPDNIDALLLARRFHEEVRALLPELEPLPEQVTVEQQTLF